MIDFTNSIERLLAYKWMLKHYQEGYLKLGFCNALLSYITDDDDLYDYINITSSFKNLVELQTFKPVDYASYWFPTSDTQVRIDILEKCIQMIEEKANTYDELH